MSQYHFFPDTNFFVDYPDFPSQFLFDDELFTVVVSTPVLVELDKLKKRDDSSRDRAYRARQTIRTIDELFRGKLVLAGGKGTLARYTPRLRGRRSFDHEIVDLVEQYQEEQPDGTKTVLLSDDANLRNYARGGAVLVEDPEEWLYEQTYKRRTKQIVQVDEGVREAHLARVDLEGRLESAGPSDSSAEGLQEQLQAARHREKLEVARYELERYYVDLPESLKDYSGGMGLPMQSSCYGIPVFVDDGHLLAVRSSGAGLYDLSSEEELWWIDFPVIAEAADVNGTLLALGGELPYIYVWDVSTGRLRQTLPSLGERVGSLALSPDGRILAAGTDDRMWLWRVADAKLLYTSKGPAGGARHLRFSLDGSKLLSLVPPNPEGPMVQVRQVEDGALVQTIRADRGFSSPSSVCFLRGGEAIAVWQGESAMMHRLLDGLGIGALIAKGPDHICGLTLSPDGLVLAGFGKEHVYLWRFADSPDGQVRVADLLPHAEAIRLQMGEPRHVLAHTAAPPVYGVAFSPDGQILATGAYDGVRLWRVEDGELSRAWLGQDDQ
jgi:hypothetical protein